MPMVRSLSLPVPLRTLHPELDFRNRDFEPLAAVWDPPTLDGGTTALWACRRESGSS